MKKPKIKRFNATKGMFGYSSSIEIADPKDDESYNVIDVICDKKKDTEALSKHLVKAIRDFYNKTK